MKSNTLLASAVMALASLAAHPAWAAQDLNVYGPGGPAPP